MDEEIVVEGRDVKEDRLVVEKKLCEEREVLGEQLEEG